MPKLDIEFELTGLKLKIKGDSDDTSGKVADLQRQIASLVGTINSLTQQATQPQLHGSSPSESTQKLIDVPQPSDTATKTRKAITRKASGAPKVKAEAIDFKHDAEKFGFPKQAWSTAQKAMWMLHMLAESGDTKEFTAAQIANAFNKHFKSFGTIRAQNVLRDLGKEKGKSGAVNSDASQDPMRWFLLETGRAQMAAILAEPKAVPAE